MSTKQKVYRIAIDGNETNVEQRLGSNVYAFSLLQNLEEITRGDSSIQCSIFLAKPPVSDLPKTRPGWNYTIIGPAKLWTQWAAPLYLFKNKNMFDVWYTPGHYAPRFCPIPYVTSVMDLGYHYFPEQYRANDLYQLKNWTEYSVKKAKKIVAISQSTQEEINKVYGIPKEKIEIVYPAVENIKRMSDKKATSLLTKLGIASPYFVYIGTMQPRKNLVRVIRAFEIFCDTLAKQRKSKVMHDEITLVLAGKLGWQTEPITEAIKKSPRTSQIITPGFVSNDEKTALLQQTEAQLLIGLHEGFGIPALEALHLDTIPIVSDTTSLPEVVGSAGLLVNPYNVTEIAEAMKNVVSMSPQRRGALKRHAQTQRKVFNWKNSAEKLLTLLTSTIDAS